MKSVLITGGAGFIGSTIVNQIHDKFEVVVLDNFSKQIHGEDYTRSYLYNSIKDKAHIIKGDVRNYDDITNALNGVDYVIHLAAETGTGQSMYEINRYTDVNIMGTSNLLQSILENKYPIKKIILSSSRAVYGEGLYFCKEHGLVTPNPRSVSDMKNGDFNVKCPFCGENVEVRPTTEDSKLNPASYYAYTKMAQEKMLEVMCPSLKIPYTIFRYQNVYGPGQSLNNPYTGILSIFSKLFLSNKPINIFEDGKESRDFINVKDVAFITWNALENEQTNNQCINVGFGESVSVMEIAKTLKKFYNSQSEINVTGDFRIGDIRHNIADISKAKELCNFKPKYTFEQGMKEFTDWVLEEHKKNSLDLEDTKYKKSLEELHSTGMLIRGTK